MRVNKYLLPNSLYRAARFANFEGILDFSVPSSGVGFNSDNNNNNNNVFI